MDLKEIGSGGYARIELFEWIPEKLEKPPLQVALKTNFKTFKREYNFFRMFRHKHIVEVYGYTFNEDLNENSLIMEVARCSLLDCVSFNKIGTETRVEWCLGLASAVKYLHCDLTHPVLHKDIKMSNLLIFQPENASEDCFVDSILKLTDFGSSSTTVSNLQTPDFSPRKFGWVAEEVQESAGRNPTVKSDMFAVGLTSTGILLKSNLRKERKQLDKKEIKNTIFYYNHSDIVSKSEDINLRPYRELLISCLDKEPENRPDAKDFLFELNLIKRRGNSSESCSICSLNSISRHTDFDISLYFKTKDRWCDNDDEEVWLEIMTAVNENPELLEEVYEDENSREITIFIRACGRGDLGIVKNLIELGADVSQTLSDKMNGLIFAAKNGKTSMIRFLHSQNNHLIHAENFWGETAFIHACLSADLKTVETLVEFGSDNSVTDSRGRNGLLIAASGCRNDIIKLLNSENPELINAKDSSGKNAIQLTKRNDTHSSARKQATIQLLKDLGCKQSFFNFFE